MLGNTAEHTKRDYLSINHGKVIKGSGAAKEEYSYIEGIINAIYTKRSTFGSETVTRWYMDMRDGEETYTLCLPYSSGVFKSIVLALASDEELTRFTPVRIEPYEGNNGYTKVVVYSNGIKRDWVTKQLPPTKSINVGGKAVKDDSDQMKFICSLVNTIQQRIYTQQ